MTDAVTLSLNQLFDNNIAAVSKQAQAASSRLSEELNNSLQSMADSLASQKLPQVSQSIANTLNLEQSLIQNSLQSVWDASSGVENLLTNSAEALTNIKTTLVSSFTNDIGPALFENGMDSLGSFISEKANLDKSLIDSSLSNIVQSSGGLSDLLNDFQGSFSSIKNTALTELKDTITPALLDNAQESLSSAVADKLSINTDVVSSFVGDIRQAIGNPFELAENLSAVGENLKNALADDSAINMLQSLGDAHLPKVGQSIANALTLDETLVTGSLERIWQASGGVDNLVNNFQVAFGAIKATAYYELEDVITPALLDNAQENISNAIAEKFKVNVGIVNNFVGDIRQAIGNPFEIGDNLASIGENLQAALQGDSASNLAKGFAEQYIGGASDAILSAFKVKNETIKSVATQLTSAFTSVDNVITDFPQALENVSGAIVELGQQHLATLADNTAALISRRVNLVQNVFATQGFTAGVKSLTRQFRLLGRLGILKVKRAVSTLVTGIRLATAQFWAFNASMFANPFIAIAAGIVAVVTVIGAVIYKYWEPIKTFMSGLFDGLLSALEPVRQALAPVFLALEPIFSAIGSAIGWIVDAFSNLFTPVQSTAAELAKFGSIGESVGSVLGAVFSFLLSPITLVADGIGWLSDKFSGLAELASGIFGGIASFFGGDDDEDEDEEEKEEKAKEKIKRNKKQIKTAVDSSISEQTVAAQVATVNAPETASNVVNLNQYRVAQKTNNAQLVQPQTLGSINQQRQNIVPIKSQATKSDVAVNAPITINAAANQNPQEIAAMVKVELDKREQQAQLKQRGALYDIG